MASIIFQLSFVAYFLALSAYLVHFFSQRDEIASVAHKIFLAALFLHTLNIGVRFADSSHVPIFTMHEIVSFFAWSIAWAYLSFRWRQTVKNFGVFAAFMVFLLMLLSVFSSSETMDIPPSFSTWLFPVHACITMVASAFLSLSFVGAIMYLLQERELKNKRFGFFYHRLPSLDALERLNYHCVSVGFILMTMGMFAGYIWVRNLEIDYNWLWDGKIIASLLTWLLYAVLLHQRITVGWRGKRTALLTIFTFGGMVATIVFVLLGAA